MAYSLGFCGFSGLGSRVATRTEAPLTVLMKGSGLNPKP